MDLLWLATGGAYVIVLGGWAIVAIASYLASVAIGKQLSIPQDGCLLGAANVLFSAIGCGLGLMAAPYPQSIISALMGMVALPALAIILFVFSNRRPRRR